MHNQSSQQFAMQVAPPPASPAQVDFNLLHSVLQENVAMKDRAVTAITGYMQQIEGLDLLQLDIIQGDQIDATLADMQSRGADSVAVAKERRMVFTKEFDRVKSLFTAAEKEMETQIEVVKTWRSRWNAEKYRRDAEAKQKAAAELAHKNAIAEFAGSVRHAMNLHYIALLDDHIARLNQAFNHVTLELFEDYEDRLRAYQPEFTKFEYATSLQPHPLLKPDECQQICWDVEAEMYKSFAADYVEKISAERDRLVSCLPSRRAELEDAGRAQEAKERIEREEKERLEKLRAQREQLIKAAESVTETEKMNNQFEAIAAQPAIAMSKGTTRKEKYNPVSHKAFIAIIQWWVSAEMGSLTIEELNKKFSFMLTAANKALNGGHKIEAEGLLIEEDFTVRKAR